jgi:hypothetical protein
MSETRLNLQHQVTGRPENARTVATWNMWVHYQASKMLNAFYEYQYSPRMDMSSALTISPDTANVPLDKGAYKTVVGPVNYEWNNWLYYSSKRMLAEMGV